MKKYILLSLSISFFFCSFAQVGSNGTNISFPVLGFRYGVCSSDAMYYSTKNLPNQFDPNKSGTQGYDKSFEDKFSYWGTQVLIEQYSKNGYFMADFSGVGDFLVYLPFGNSFRTGKLKNFGTNFPQGDDKSQNLGGVYTDVFATRVAGGFQFADKLYLKIGGHYNYGIQRSVADFAEQTGTNIFVSQGYKHTYGLNLNFMVENKQGFVWRNSFLYNFHSGDSKGTGFKIESVAYLGGIICAGVYFQSTNLLGKKAEPWIYGEGNFISPSANFTNFGFTISFIYPTRSNQGGSAE
jgi:hypothetical protein